MPSMIEINKNRLTSPYKKYTTSLKRGTYLELMGEVAVTAPNVCTYTDKYDLISAGQCMPSPIVIILTSKIYENDIVVNISYTTGVFSRWDVRNEAVYIIGTNSSASVTIPAYSKEGEIFLVPDVNDCVDVTATDVVGGTRGTETFKVMALASSNTRILYLEDFSDIKKLFEDIKWHRYINQLPCWTCRGTGLLQDVTCPTCNGFTQDKYAAWLKSIDYIGLDLNKLRESDETDIQYQRRLWGHRRWVIPRKPDGLELNVASVFAHYLDVAEEYIHIYEVPAQFDGNDDVNPPGTYFDSWYLDPTSNPIRYTMDNYLLIEGNYWRLKRYDEINRNDVIQDWNFALSFEMINGVIITDDNGTRWFEQNAQAVDTSIEYWRKTGYGASYNCWCRSSMPVHGIGTQRTLYNFHQNNDPFGRGSTTMRRHYFSQDIDMTSLGFINIPYNVVYSGQSSTDATSRLYVYIDDVEIDSVEFNETNGSGTFIIDTRSYSGTHEIKVQIYHHLHCYSAGKHCELTSTISPLDPLGYYQNGYLTTEKIFTNENVSAETIFKYDLNPTGTQIYIRYRTAETEIGLDTAPYSAWFSMDELEVPPALIRPWIQYQLRFNTSSYGTSYLYNTYLNYNYYSGAWTIPGTHNINPIWICSMPAEYWGENYWWHAEQDEVNFRKMVESLNPLGTVARTEFYLNVPPESEDPTYNSNMKDKIDYEDSAIIYTWGHDFSYYVIAQITENTGSNQNNMIVDPILFNAPAGRCYEDSIRVYDDVYGTGTEIECQLYDIIRSGDYITSCKIALIDNFLANETKTYYIYYRLISRGSTGYINIPTSGTDPITITTDDGTPVIELTDTQRFITSYEDVNSIEWFIAGGEIGIWAAFGGATTGTTETGPIFVENLMNAGANEYYYVKTYKNGLNKITAMNDANYNMHNRPLDGLVSAHFIDALNYHIGAAWASVGDPTSVNVVVDQGTGFFDDTGHKQTICFLVWDETQGANAASNILLLISYGGPSYNVIDIGNSGVLAYPANTEIIIWSGIKDTGSLLVADKRDYIDNLYDLLITNPPTIGAIGSEQEVQKELIGTEVF